MSASRELRLEQLLGRELLGGNNQPVGRIEEFRAQRRGDRFVIVEVVIGMLGLLERVNVSAHLMFGAQRRGCVAEWDQIDFSNPSTPRLMVSIDELKRI